MSTYNKTKVWFCGTCMSWESLDQVKRDPETCYNCQEEMTEEKVGDVKTWLTQRYYHIEREMDNLEEYEKNICKL